MDNLGSVIIFRSTSRNFPLDIKPELRAAGYTVVAFDSFHDYITSSMRLSPNIVVIEIGTSSDLDRCVMLMTWNDRVQPLAPTRYVILMGSKNIRFGRHARKFSSAEIAVLPQPARNLLFKMELKARLLKNTPVPAPVLDSFVARFEEVAIGDTGRKRVISIRGRDPSKGSWKEVGKGPGSKIRWRWITAPGEPVADPNLSWEADGEKEPEYDEKLGAWILDSEEDDLVCKNGGEVLFSAQEADVSQKAQSENSEATEETQSAWNLLQSVEGESDSEKRAAEHVEEEETQRDAERAQGQEKEEAEKGGGLKKTESPAAAQEKSKTSADLEEKEKEKKAAASKTAAEPQARANAESPRKSEEESLQKKPLQAELADEEKEIKSRTSPKTEEPTKPAPQKEKTTGKENVQAERAQVTRIAQDPEQKRADKFVPSPEPGTRWQIHKYTQDEENRNTSSGRAANENEVGSGKGEKKAGEDEAGTQQARRKSVPEEAKKQDESSRSGEYSAESPVRRDRSNEEWVGRKVSWNSYLKPGEDEAGKAPERKTPEANSEKKTDSSTEAKPAQQALSKSKSTKEELESLLKGDRDDGFLPGAKKTTFVKGKVGSFRNLTSIVPGGEIAEEGKTKIAPDVIEADSRSVPGGGSPEDTDSRRFLKFRHYGVMTLSQLNDHESSWHPVGRYRIYLAAQHRYFGVHHPAAVLPLWIYEGELAPEFLEENKAWKFYDQNPIAVNSIEALPMEVLEYLNGISEKPSGAVVGVDDADLQKNQQNATASPGRQRKADFPDMKKKTPASTDPVIPKGIIATVIGLFRWR